MTKIDMKKEDRCFYSGRKGRFDIVTVPEMNFLQIDGKGDPNASKAFSSAVAALFALSYNIKFHSKLELQRDYAVMPLEALWWAEDEAVFQRREKDEWLWTAMIRQPDWIELALLDSVLEATVAKINRKREAATDEGTLRRVRLARWSEGECVQTLHLGSFDSEGPVLEEMHGSFIPKAGASMRGKHHEIYLSDLRRTPSDRLRTILRQPVELSQGGISAQRECDQVDVNEELA
ncbi:GyrI-like domain-containing protein [Maricaulis sp. MIT060901]|uniref:GyrI-like domain-containing protein n=1 Tax=Maricaulis sp. MIT060901 TaxID=3096993 RepID=UPI0039999CCD